MTHRTADKLRLGLRWLGMFFGAVAFGSLAVPGRLRLTAAMALAMVICLLLRFVIPGK